MQNRLSFFCFEMTWKFWLVQAGLNYLSQTNRLSRQTCTAHNWNHFEWVPYLTQNGLKLIQYILFWRHSALRVWYKYLRQLRDAVTAGWDCIRLVTMRSMVRSLPGARIFSVYLNFRASAKWEHNWFFLRLMDGNLCVLGRTNLNELN